MKGDTLESINFVLIYVKVFILRVLCFTDATSEEHTYNNSRRVFEHLAEKKNLLCPF